MTPRGLDASHHRQQLRAGDVGSPLAADVGKDVRLQPGDELVAIALGPAVLAHREPLPSDGFEAAHCGQALRLALLGDTLLGPHLSLGLALLAGVEAFGEQLSGCFGLAARQGERGVGEGAERERVALSLESVVEAPAVHPAPGEEQQNEAATVGEPLARIVRFHGADGGFRRDQIACHGVKWPFSAVRSGFTPLFTPSGRDLTRAGETSRDMKKALSG